MGNVLAEFRWGEQRNSVGVTVCNIKVLTLGTAVPFKTKIVLFTCVRVCMQMCVEVRGQRSRVSSYILPCGIEFRSWGLVADVFTS